MEKFSIRWQNFRCLKDTGWLQIRPITIVIGPNASGKTSLHAPLLLMKQTLDSPDTSLFLKVKGDLFNAGSYRDLIFNHETTNILAFSIRDERYKGEIDSKDRKEIGVNRPGELNIEFDIPKDSNHIYLRKFQVRDIFGRELVQRVRLKSGKFSIQGPNYRDIDRKLKDVIRDAPPEHFLFTFEPLFNFKIEKAIKEEEKPSEFTFEEPESLYLSVIRYVGGWIQYLLSNISYIGPLRQHPKRLYEVTDEKPLDVGVRGQNTPEILFQENKTDLMKSVNEWVSKFEFGFQISCEDLSHGAYEILLRRNKDAPGISLADTGFGLSQVLPLIVQGFYAKKGSIIIAEQPEIHLNPKLQALLSDLFVSIAKNGTGVIVETHSEHLLLRLRRLVADGSISAEDVGLYYVEKTGGTSSIREVPIEDDGHINSETWPKRFFEDALSESLALASAQYERSKENAS